MSLETKVVAQIKDAMRAKDKVRLEALRSIKTSILNAKTEKGASDTLSDASELKLLQRLQKQRKDALEIYEQQNREDLAADERGQLIVIEEFLPKPMSAAELESRISEIISSTSAEGMKDMGKVMGMASKSLAGKADGKAISAVVKKLLST